MDKRDTKPKVVKATASKGGIENLKPFKKGQSGNPSGRKKVPEDVKLAFRSLTMDAVRTLTEVMHHGDNDSSRIRAAEIILNRAWGTPTQAVELTGAEGKDLGIRIIFE